MVSNYATGGKQNRQRMYNWKYQLADGLHIAACTSTTLNAVAKENIHVRAKVLVSLKFIGSCITGSQPKRVFHMRHSVAVFANELITQIDRR